MNNDIITFTKNLLEGIHVPVHFLTLPCEEFPWLDQGLRAALPDTEYDFPFIKRYMSQIKPRTICHTVDTFHCRYTMFYPPESEELMICGPVLLEEITPELFQEIARNMGVPEDAYPILKNFYLHLPAFPARLLYQNLFTTLGDTLWGENNYEVIHMDFNDMDKWYESHKINQAAFNADLVNLPLIERRYSLENQALEAVSKGNEQKAQELISMLCTSFTPHGFINNLRDYQDHTLSLNTLMRKKAEEVGIHPIHLDLYSRQNVMQAEETSTKEQCYALLRQMVKGYCMLVNTYRRADYSLLTQKIVAYVDTDLSADLSLKAMSERLSVNASYLSTLFKKEMGIPLTDYVNRQRMEQAKKLLVITDLPAKTIAQECGISDVYYFNRLFKKITGYTPKVYRESATREHEPMDAV